MNYLSKAALLVLLLILSAQALKGRIQSCKPSGKIIGKKPLRDNATGNMILIAVNKGSPTYTTYKCSPPVSGSTNALLTINSFEEGGDEAVRQNVTISTTLMTHQSSPYQLVGTVEGADASTT